MNIRSPLFALAVVIPALVGCGSGSYEMEIAPSKVNCSGVGEHLCLVNEIDGEQDRLYEGIEGFSYEWCHRHRLLVHEEAVLMPMADQSSIRYVLDEQLESTFVPGHEMTISLFDEWLAGDELVLDFEMRCAAGEEALCDDVRAALADEGADRVEATFRCEEGEEAPRLLSFTEPTEG